MNRSEVSSKWNKCRIYVGGQLDRWNELKEVLRVQTRAEVAKILLDRQAEHVFSFFFQSFFIFYEFKDTSLLFIYLSESVKVCFLPRVDSFSFAQEPHVVYCF
jgi:hypothetical protein